MSEGRVVIVGAGQGGLQAAMSLRQEGHAGPITLIGGEDGLPYQRPPLSKAFLKTGEADKLTLRPKAFFAAKDITLLAGQWVDAIDRTARTVQFSDKTLTYDHLVLATGTRNVQPPIPGVELTIGLRTLDDARHLRRELDRPRRVAVIGGGFIGLEFAAVACELGHAVSVVEAAPRLMARAVSTEMSDWFREKHEKLGTQLYLGAEATQVSADGVMLADGTEIPADLVLLAAGVRPNTDLAEAAGLQVRNGILTDAQLCTKDARIHALGDCAAFPDIRSGREVRLESVQAATDHARAIAKHIVHGDMSRYSAVPWFWSDQADWKLQIAGLATSDDDSVAVKDNTVLRFAHDTLTAVETINNAKCHMKARRLLAQQPPPGRDMLAAHNYDLAVC